MKKVILFFVLLHISTSMFGMQLLRKFFHSKRSNVTQEVVPVKPKVAMILLTNDIDFKSTMFTLAEVARNKEIQGIILIIDNHGGEMGTFCAMHDLIKKISSMKPVISLITGGALSGGYMLACASEYIISHSGSEIGNIGVICEMTKYKNPKIAGNLKADMEVEIYSGGEFKGLFNPYKELSEQDKEYMKESIAKRYECFLDIVAHHRNISKEDAPQWAAGKVHLPHEAIALGLIDSIGTIFEAEQKMLECIATRSPETVFDTEINPVFYELQKASA